MPRVSTCAIEPLVNLAAVDEAFMQARIVATLIWRVRFGFDFVREHLFVNLMLRAP